MLDDNDKAAVHRTVARNYPGHNVRVEHVLMLKKVILVVYSVLGNPNAPDLTNQSDVQRVALLTGIAGPRGIRLDVIV
jgi:hypothetical protein